MTYQANKQEGEPHGILYRRPAPEGREARAYQLINTLKKTAAGLNWPQKVRRNLLSN